MHERLNILSVTSKLKPLLHVALGTVEFMRASQERHSNPNAALLGTSESLSRLLLVVGRLIHEQGVDRIILLRHLPNSGALCL